MRKLYLLARPCLGDLKINAPTVGRLFSLGSGIIAVVTPGFGPEIIDAVMTEARPGVIILNQGVLVRYR